MGSARRVYEEVTLAVGAKADVVGQVGVKHDLLQVMGASTKEQIHAPVMHAVLVDHASLWSPGRTCQSCIVSSPGCVACMGPTEQACK